MKKKIIVLCGIPGSGKSTLARKIFLKNPERSIIVSSDKIREMITATTDENVATTFTEVYSDVIHTRILAIKDHLISFFIEDKSIDIIIADSTHFTPESRKFLIHLKKEFEVIFVLLVVEKDEAFQRVQQRPRKVGMGAIIRISEGLQGYYDDDYDFILKNETDVNYFLKKI